MIDGGMDVKKYFCNNVEKRRERKKKEMKKMDKDKKIKINK